MDDRDGPLLGIGTVAAMTGLPVRTIRFWSDAGLVPPTARSSAGQRRYSQEAVARVQLVATLRALGLGLQTIQAVLDQRADLRQIAAVHARALQAEIRSLSVRRAVLLAVAARGASFETTTEEMNQMKDLARLSGEQRQRLVEDLITETFGAGPDQTGIAGQMCELTPALPDDPSPEQVNAWIEVAELVQDASFRDRVREMAQAGARQPEPLDREAGQAFAATVAEQVGPALAAGLDPASTAAAAVLDRNVPATPHTRPATPDTTPAIPDTKPAAPDTGRAELADRLATFTDARVDRYWQLVGVINGWPTVPSQAPAFQWLIEALRSHPAT
jgi:DNA-binding transcriptional MerR regulator